MTYILPGSLAALLAIVIFMLIHRPTKDKITKVANKTVGVCEITLQRSSKKSARKAKVLELLRETNELSNTDIREEIGVSARSVVYYMNELESSGEVEQVGSIGQNVMYRLKT